MAARRTKPLASVPRRLQFQRPRHQVAARLTVASTTLITGSITATRLLRPVHVYVWVTYVSDDGGETWEKPRSGIRRVLVRRRREMRPDRVMGARTFRPHLYRRRF